MTDQQKLNYLLTELKLAAQQDSFHESPYKNSPLQEVFERGEVYGWSSFARGLLLSMGENLD